VLEDGLAGVVRMVENTDADQVILASTSCVFLVDQESLRDRMKEAGEQVVKLSVGRTPVEVYISRREHIVPLLREAAERDTGRRSLRTALFDGFLHSALDIIVDVPGEILFQNDLMEYYASNIWVVANCESPRFHSAVSRLPELADKGLESHIAERGSIRNSWLASGVEVEGSVEDSILFPNVLVRRNSLVSRSVVLSGNRIGSGTEIHSALILPYTAEVPRPVPNIGDNCAIGVRSSVMKNTDYPAHIHGGIAVVGMNADIPNSFTAEAATYIASGVPSSVLRRIKVLKKGASVLRDRSAAPGSGAGSGQPS
jgi:carbonic anhydrase/acetyltransferase-like protein (isoleucine patch superfamily)